jgi:hypothetical protein
MKAAFFHLLLSFSFRRWRTFWAGPVGPDSGAPCAKQVLQDSQSTESAKLFQRPKFLQRGEKGFKAAADFDRLIFSGNGVPTLCPRLFPKMPIGIADQRKNR